MQRRHVVTRHHPHRFLGQHRTGVHPGVDDVHGAPGDPHTTGQGVGDGVRPGKSRQQGGMAVDDPTLEPGQDRRPEEPHEARADDPVRRQLREHPGEGTVPGGPVGVLPGGDHGCPDPVSRRDLQRSRSGAVRHQRDDLPRCTLRGSRRHERLEQRTGTGGEDDDTGHHRRLGPSGSMGRCRRSVRWRRALGSAGGR